MGSATASRFGQNGSEVEQPSTGGGWAPTARDEAPARSAAAPLQVLTLPDTPAALYAELCRIADVLVAIAALAGVFFIYQLVGSSAGVEAMVRAHVTPRNLVLLAVFTGLWQEVFFLLGLDRFDTNRRFRDDLPMGAIAAAAGAGLLAAMAPFSRSGIVTVPLVVTLWVFALVLAPAARVGLRAVVTAGHPSRRPRVLIVGSGPRALDLQQELCAGPDAQCEFAGFVDTRDGLPAPTPEVREQLIGRLEDLDRILMHTIVDEVLIALPIKSRYSEIQNAIEQCERSGIQAKYLAEPFRSSLAGTRMEATGRHRVVTVKVSRDDTRLLIKRLVDIVGAALGLVILSPLLLATGVAIKLTSDGPVLFRQERYGLHKRRFTLFKFRTMVPHADALLASLEDRNEATGPAFKIRHDPRITRIGGFLRRTSIDELPQLYNVLRGDMSLVGPRPMSVRDVHLFEEPWLMRRFSVMPGLTCLWQISGRSTLSFDDWIALDLRYIDRWSLALDLDILLRTVPAVLRGTGAE